MIPIQADLERLAQFTEPARPYTRRAFTDLYLTARRWLSAQMAAAGLTLWVDAAGNLIGRLAGARPDLPPLLIGSHIDTVVGGGRFDGIIGVLAGVEVARWLRESGVACREGRSHAPEEWAEVADVAAGAEALGRTLLALDRAWCAGRGEASGR